MADLALPTDPKAALYTVGLYLAQTGAPHKDLGYRTQMEAFEDVGIKFHVPKLSVRNVRDMFDRFTDSHRVGWENEALPERFDVILGSFRDIPRADFAVLVQQILEQEWSGLEKEHDLEVTDNRTEIQRFCDDVEANFELPKYTMLAESYATTWGFVNSKGRPFKISNLDLEKTLAEILDAWDDWVAAGLNTNNKNPDDDLPPFAAKNFSAGAHQVMANDQRRGFLHFISNIVHAAIRNTPFDAAASAIPFEKDDYRKALEIISEIRKNSSAFSRELPTSVGRASEAKQTLKGGENVIFYGAPGTGKSNRVKTTIEDAGKTPIRTVFHPDLQNSDFFGCLKPRMDGDNVRYEFAPGPFMEALREAYETPNEPVFLVIEELNRAAAAAVFGDLFLLLDRDDDGASEYTVSFPSPESRAWFEGKTQAVHTRIELPSNLFIYATMNSADQGVYPIDTAFRRRWRQEYLPLDYKKGPDGEIAYIDADGKPHTLEWREFVEVLNNYLVSNQTLAIAEDRLLGQWFVKKKELVGTGIPEKILLYLWDDLLRHEGRDQIFDTVKIATYGALDKASKDGSRFLSATFLGVLNTISKAEPESVDADDAG